jgi:hypothetical protein
MLKAFLSWMVKRRHWFCLSTRVGQCDYQLLGLPGTDVANRGLIDVVVPALYMNYMSDRFTQFV